jgi:hypothetical protein
MATLLFQWIGPIFILSWPLTTVKGQLDGL